MELIRLAVAALILAVGFGSAPVGRAAPRETVCAKCLRATMERLAGEQMRGRKCGSAEENRAAKFLAAEFARVGVRPAAPGRTYLQSVELSSDTRATVPGSPASAASPGQTTFNVLGVIRGTSRDADKRAILLTAHYDHVGVRDGVIYLGANDDASGTAAVLEFARILAKRPPRRTIFFGLFGCEEAGGLGAKYFLDHPVVPLTDIAANIEFEMVGARDPQMPDALMMTGFERSNLGPTLQAQGARIAQDRYPQQHFFERSDNIFLAKRGVVAHTISAWPMPPTYHRPTDDLSHLDFDYMTEVVGSLVAPLTWLANSDFRPAWNAGQQPAP